MNRREFSIAAGAILLSPTAPLLSIGLPTQPQTTRPYSDEMPDMLVSYVAERLNKLAAIWDQKRARLKSASDVAARNAFVRARFVAMLHGFPQRTPLNPMTVKVMERDGYRIETARHFHSV